MNQEVAEIRDILTEYVAMRLNAVAHGIYNAYDLAELNISKERLDRLYRAREEIAKVMFDIISDN